MSVHERLFHLLWGARHNNLDRSEFLVLKLQILRELAHGVYT
jgi:hypothetical protein